MEMLAYLTSKKTLKNQLQSPKNKKEPILENVGSFLTEKLKDNLFRHFSLSQDIHAPAIQMNKTQMLKDEIELSLRNEIHQKISKKIQLKHKFAITPEDFRFFMEHGLI